MQGFPGIFYICGVKVTDLVSLKRFSSSQLHTLQCDKYLYICDKKYPLMYEHSNWLKCQYLTASSNTYTYT